MTVTITVSVKTGNCYKTAPCKELAFRLATRAQRLYKRVATTLKYIFFRQSSACREKLRGKILQTCLTVILIVQLKHTRILCSFLNSAFKLVVLAVTYYFEFNPDLSSFSLKFWSCFLLSVRETGYKDSGENINKFIFLFFT